MAVLRPCLGHLAAILGHLYAIPEAIGPNTGGTLTHPPLLGMKKRLLRPSWDALGPSWSHLGDICVATCILLKNDVSPRRGATFAMPELRLEALFCHLAAI